MANTVHLKGNITRETQSVPTRGNTPMAFLNLAATRQWQGLDGEIRQDTAFPSVVCFGELADYAIRNGGKGRPVEVEGSLRTRRRETEDGPRYELEVVASSVLILEARTPAVDEQEAVGVE